jgi:endonuclease/exonuclease/phosphatase family metal-dependent hydrolase
MKTSPFLSLIFALLFVQVGQQARPDVISNVKTVSAATAVKDDKSSLLEIGSGLRLRPVEAHQEIKVISYNIRWRAGDDLKKLIQLFKEDQEIGNAAILALQEVDRNKKRTRNFNTVKQIADELGLYYAWAAPPVSRVGDEEETGVALLSAYPLADVRRIVLPHEGPNHRRRVALGATIKLAGSSLRVYSVHGETRISMDKKVEQMAAVIRDLDRYPNYSALILGDLNTWEPNAGSRTKKLFTGASFTTPFADQTTFSRRILFVPIDLRLDWMWLRGLTAVQHGIDRQITISDHFPLWLTIKVPTEK